MRIQTTHPHAAACCSQRSRNMCRVAPHSPSAFLCCMLPLSFREARLLLCHTTPFACPPLHAIVADAPVRPRVLHAFAERRPRLPEQADSTLERRAILLLRVHAIQTETAIIQYARTIAHDAPALHSYHPAMGRRQRRQPINPPRCSRLLELPKAF